MQLSHRRIAEKRKFLDEDRCIPTQQDLSQMPQNQFLDQSISDDSTLSEFHHLGTFPNIASIGGAHRAGTDICDDSTSALLEFARENLLLKRELHIANSELARLQSVVQARENQKKGTQYNSDDEPKSQRRYWTDQEHERFLDAIQNFGHKNVKAISAYVGTRSATQVRTHAQKYFLKAARENKAREKATMISVDSASVNDCSESEQRGCDRSEVQPAGLVSSSGSLAMDDPFADSGKQISHSAARWQVERNGRDPMGQNRGCGDKATAQGRNSGDEEQGGEGDSQSARSDGEFEDEESKTDPMFAGEEQAARRRREALQHGHMLS